MGVCYRVTVERIKETVKPRTEWKCVMSPDLAKTTGGKEYAYVTADLPTTETMKLYEQTIMPWTIGNPDEATMSLAEAKWLMAIISAVNGA